jgi:hypothetical protein
VPSAFHDHIKRRLTPATKNARFFAHDDCAINSLAQTSDHQIV